MTPLEQAQAERARRAQQRAAQSPLEQAEAEQARRGSAPVTAGGLSKAFSTGLRSGVESVVAAPGNLVDWEVSKVAELAKYLGASDETVAAIEEYRRKMNEGGGGSGPGMATTADVQAATDAAVQRLPEGAAQTVQNVTRHQPGNVAEEWMQTGGNFAGGAALPGGPMMRIARVLFPTAAVEGAGQATRALAPEYENTARLVAGILAGGVQGGVETAAALRSSLKTIGTNPAALKRVQQLLVEQGMTPDEAATAMQQLGPDATLMDVGPATRQEGQRIQARGGEGRTTLDTTLREREAAANQRLATDVEAAIGPEVQRQDVLAALKDRSQSLGPEYEAAHRAQVKPVETQPIVDKIDSELGVVKSPKIGGILQRIKKSLMLRDTDQLDPSSEGLHAARKAIDAELYDVNGKPKMDLSPEEAGTLKHYRGLIDEALGESGPIKDVDVKRSQIGKEERAFKTGEEVYNATRDTLSPVEFQRGWDAMSAGEQARMLEGLNRETYRQIGLNANDRTKLQALLKGEGKWNQQKVATVIGEERAQALMDALQRERTFQETYQKVVQGSKTAETQPGGGGIAGAVADAVPETVVAGSLGGPAAAAGVGLTSLRRSLVDALRSRNNPAVARLLASQRPDDLLQAYQIMREQENYVLPGAALGGLLARQDEVQRRKER